MTTTTAPNPYDMPVKVKGEEMPRISLQIEESLFQAIKNVAAQESRRLGVKVSYGTLVSNLVHRDTIDVRRIRSKLDQEYVQLNKENHRGNEPTTPQEPEPHP